MHNREKPRKFIKEASIPATEEETIEPESILFTTDEMGEAVLIKGVNFEETTPDDTPKVGGQPQYATATSLLQLSQSNTVIQIAGTSDEVSEGQSQEYMLVKVTTDDDEQKFMPISHLSTLIANAVTAPSTSSTSWIMILQAKDPTRVPFVKSALHGDLHYAFIKCLSTKTSKVFFAPNVDRPSRLIRHW